jgi:hypothetical protein
MRRWGNGGRLAFARVICQHGSVMNTSKARSAAAFRFARCVRHGRETVCVYLPALQNPYPVRDSARAAAPALPGMRVRPRDPLGLGAGFVCHGLLSDVFTQHRTHPAAAALRMPMDLLRVRVRSRLSWRPAQFQCVESYSRNTERELRCLNPQPTTAVLSGARETSSSPRNHAFRRHSCPLTRPLRRLKPTWPGRAARLPSRASWRMVSCALLIPPSSCPNARESSLSPQRQRSAANLPSGKPIRVRYD